MNRKWYLIDASTMPLGRLATTIAGLLIGKHKVNQAPHIDSGDYVVVINSDKLQVTGNKLKGKLYYSHSGYPGGIHQKSLGDILKRNSAEIIKHAVRGMLPDNKLRRARLSRLKVYRDDQHPHTAQNPQPLTKNKIKYKVKDDK
jgi:large subunit ribosomal protein L13